MNYKERPVYTHRIITIPNILSAFRLCLIPFIIWLYCVKSDFTGTAALLVLSALTDMVDGFIARRYHMESNLGKILDPIADKVTQGAVLFCLLSRFPLMWIPLALMALKELFAGITGFMVIRKTGKIYGADWHGKAATALLYAMMFLHVAWPEIPTVYSDTLIALCMVMMLISFILYGIRNIGALKKANCALFAKGGCDERG